MKQVKEGDHLSVHHCQRNLCFCLLQKYTLYYALLLSAPSGLLLISIWSVQWLGDALLFPVASCPTIPYHASYLSIWLCPLSGSSLKLMIRWESVPWQQFASSQLAHVALWTPSGPSRKTLKWMDQFLDNAEAEPLQMGKWWLLSSGSKEPGVICHLCTWS